MYFFLILFFASLFGIIFMVGRKLRALANGQTLPVEHVSSPSFRFEETKEFIFKITRRLGYFLLVEIIRIYVRLAEACKKCWAELKAKFQKTAGLASEPSVKQPSKFLKAIAEYKRKLGRIKEEIKEEETNSQV